MSQCRAGHESWGTRHQLSRNDKSDHDYLPIGGADASAGIACSHICHSNEVGPSSSLPCCTACAGVEHVVPRCRLDTTRHAWGDDRSKLTAQVAASTARTRFLGLPSSSTLGAKLKR